MGAWKSKGRDCLGTLYLEGRAAKPWGWPSLHIQSPLPPLALPPSPPSTPPLTIPPPPPLPPAARGCHPGGGAQGRPGHGHDTAPRQVPPGARPRRLPAPEQGLRQPEQALGRVTLGWAGGARGAGRRRAGGACELQGELQGGGCNHLGKHLQGVLQGGAGREGIPTGQPLQWDRAASVRAGEEERAGLWDIEGPGFGGEDIPSHSLLSSLLSRHAGRCRKWGCGGNGTPGHLPRALGRGAGRRVHEKGRGIGWVRRPGNAAGDLNCSPGRCCVSGVAGEYKGAPLPGICGAVV